MTFTAQDRQALARLIPAGVIEALEAVIDDWENRRGQSLDITSAQWREDAERLDSLAAELQRLLRDSPLVQGGYLGNAWAINRRNEPTRDDWGDLGGPSPAAGDLVDRLDELRALCRNADEVIRDPAKAGAEFKRARSGPSAATRLGIAILATLATHGVKVTQTNTGTAAEVLRIALPDSDAMSILRTYAERMRMVAEDCF